MPLTPKRATPGPRRRSLLAAAAGAVGTAALLTGCSSEQAAADRKRARVAHTLRETAARDSEVLLARYDSTAAAHPDLTADLHTMRSHVAQHLNALRGKSPTNTASPGGRNRIAVPPDGKSALKALADAESRTADARTEALADAPPELARLLASVAASGAVHARLLKEKAA